MKQRPLERKQQLQEEQYDFPYHYIPTWKDGVFSQTRTWSWGFRYVGGMQVVLDQLAGTAFDSLIDIGCGDGRFVREVASRYPKVALQGVDYSIKAIDLAKAMNPELDFRTVDMLEGALEGSFDVATCIEVLEHIDPDDVDRFCGAVARALVPAGRLILTVPHSNQPVTSKHYQHFDSDQLSTLLRPHFTDVSFIPFDPLSRFAVPLLYRLMGGHGSFFALTSPRLTSWFYEFYRKRYLYAASEEECWRIAVVCKRR